MSGPTFYLILVLRVIRGLPFFDFDNAARLNQKHMENLRPAKQRLRLLRTNLPMGISQVAIVRANESKAPLGMEIGLATTDAPGPGHQWPHRPRAGSRTLSAGNSLSRPTASQANPIHDSGPYNSRALDSPSRHEHSSGRHLRRFGVAPAGCGTQCRIGRQPGDAHEQQHHRRTGAECTERLVQWASCDQ